MIKLGVIRDFLLFLFLVYYAQGFLYAKGSFISQGALSLILIISIYYFFANFSFSFKGTFYKLWTILLLLNIFAFLFTGSLSNANHFSMLKGLLTTLLPFYPFYHFARKGFLKSKNLVLFFLLMLPLTIFQYYFNANQILSDRITDNINLVNNVAYSFVALIPFVFLLRKYKIFSIILMLLLMYFIIQGAKRGALLAGVIGLAYFIYFQMRTVEKTQRLRGYLLVIVAVLILGFYGYNFYIENEYLMERIESISEGNSSGRDVIFATIFDGWYNSNSFLHLLFGFGFAGSILITGGHFAHNDWLELLANFGILGIIIYGLLFYNAFKYIKSPMFGVEKKIILMTIISIWFFSTLISMFYVSSNGFLYSILLAFLIGSRKKILE